MGGEEEAHLPVSARTARAAREWREGGGGRGRRRGGGGDWHVVVREDDVRAREKRLLLVLLLLIGVVVALKHCSFREGREKRPLHFVEIELIEAMIER